MSSVLDRQEALIKGPRHVISKNSPLYPHLLSQTAQAPDCLYVIGNPNALRFGLAIVGARKATPYGITCAKRFAKLAAQKGVSIISGGAVGCDSAAHQAALEVGGLTVAVLGGGCDVIYPAQNKALFQSIVDSGGALVSEWDWDTPALPYRFRMRNRIIAGLAEASLVVEAGLPSGTFITADDALNAGREVLVVPGSISSPNSKGTNRLLFQGALPVVDDESFQELLKSLYDWSALSEFRSNDGKEIGYIEESFENVRIACDDPLIAALLAEPLTYDEILSIAKSYYGKENLYSYVSSKIEQAQQQGLIMRYRDGRYGASC